MPRQGSNTWPADLSRYSAARCQRTHGKTVIRAVTEIAASLRFDNVTTGRSVRAAQRDAGYAASAAVQAERALLAAVTR
ncbi:MAG: hypothetical protein M3Y33_01375 [Actinomycetota bacterium]|nr:hypothetical protein [Actinomycetota bacterium]